MTDEGLKAPLEMISAVAFASKFVRGDAFWKSVRMPTFLLPAMLDWAAQQDKCVTVKQDAF